MNRNDRLSNSNNAEIFAAAASRLQAGESIPDILASVPPALHDELLEMLSIVEVTEQMRNASVPRPSAAKRAAAKRQFLATAAQMRLEQQATVTPSPITTSRPVSRPAARRAARRTMNPWDRFLAGMRDLFGSGAMRLAPLVVTLALVLFGTSTVMQAAELAIPGDMMYTVKRTIRQLELELAPADQRNTVRLEQERELAEDVAKAASRADANSAVIQAVDTQVYYGRNGRLLKVGGLKVMDQFQPDANVEVFRQMTVDGDLQVGSQVELSYQIMPGQSDTVQGIALTVVAPPNEAEVIEVDVPTTEAPASDLQPTGACVVTAPTGWLTHTVQSGDNLTALAARGGTTIGELMETNCLESELIVIGAELFVPADSVRTDIPLLQCGSAVPEGWELYTVVSGDNLSRLAERSGASLEDVMAVNCLDSELIVIDEQLYLPAAE